MKIKKLTLYLLAGLLVGCVPVMSLHPLYTDKEVVFEKDLLGAWVDDSNETTWQFKCADRSEKTYELIFSDDDGQKGLFVAHLVKLQNRLFLDIFPSEPPWKEEDPNKVEWVYNTVFFVPFHTFIKIESIESQLKMRLTNDDNMKKLFREDPNAVRHELVDDRLILTASTKELQAFVLKYADDSRVFADETILNRRKPEAANAIDPNAIKANDS